VNQKIVESLPPPRRPKFHPGDLVYHRSDPAELWRVVRFVGMAPEDALYELELAGDFHGADGYRTAVLCGESTLDLGRSGAMREDPPPAAEPQDAKPPLPPWRRPAQWNGCPKCGDHHPQHAPKPVYVPGCTSEEIIDQLMKFGLNERLLHAYMHYFAVRSRHAWPREWLCWQCDSCGGCWETQIRGANLE
jgi:hypothetical protein